MSVAFSISSSTSSFHFSMFVIFSRRNTIKHTFEFQFFIEVDDALNSNEGSLQQKSTTLWKNMKSLAISTFCYQQKLSFQKEFKNSKFRHSYSAVYKWNRSGREVNNDFNALFYIKFNSDHECLALRFILSLMNCQTSCFQVLNRPNKRYQSSFGRSWRRRRGKMFDNRFSINFNCSFPPTLDENRYYWYCWCCSIDTYIVIDPQF